MSIPTYVQTKCDSCVLQVLTDRGLDIDAAKAIACSVLDIVGGPTAAQSAFVTTIIGLSTGIFGLYVATGRKWGGNTNNSTPPPFIIQPLPSPVPTPLPYDPTNQPQYGPSVKTPKPGPWGTD